MNIIKYHKLVRDRIPEIIESARKRRICDEELATCFARLK